jgi:hypothetical protein
MTMLMKIDCFTDALRGAKLVRLSTAGEQKEGMTDHFWTFGARVDGQEGGELMKPLTIVKGTSDDTLKNILREMIVAGLNPEEQLEVNTTFVPARGDRWKDDKTPQIALDQCPPRSGKNWPPYKWLAHFIHWMPVPQKISRNIKVIGRNKDYYLPYIKFKDGQFVTVSQSGWQRPETQMLFNHLMLGPEVNRRRAILKEDYPNNNLVAVMKDDGYGVHDNQHARLFEAANNMRHQHITPVGSPIEQLLDTVVNGNYKSDMKNNYYIPYQQQCIQDQLAEFNEEELNDYSLQIANGADPTTMPTFKEVNEIKLSQPTRGQVILWGKGARTRFDTLGGRRLIETGYIDTGVIKDKDGQYWNATKVDEKKRKRKAEALLSDGGKKKKKRAKTKGKMADFCECISNFIQFE